MITKESVRTGFGSAFVEMVRCDGCGMRAPLHDAGDWIEARVFQTSALILKKDLEGDFCSATCAARHYASAAGE